MAVGVDCYIEKCIREEMRLEAASGDAMFPKWNRIKGEEKNPTG